MNAQSIFISYSHADHDLVAELLKHLKVVEHLGLIPWVDDKDMTSGQDFDREIQRELAKCAAVVLVVSPDFLDSDYVRKHELPLIMAARKERGLLVLPLYLRHCGHRHLPNAVRFSSVVALNDPKKPIASFRGNDRDEPFVAVVETLLAAMPKAQPNPAFDPPTVPTPSITPTHSGDQLLDGDRTDEPVAKRNGPWLFRAVATGVLTLLIAAGIAYLPWRPERILTGVGNDRALTEAIASIADKTLCPLYEGLRLRKEAFRDFHPLGPDPDSGLWEFAIRGSGTIPSRDPKTRRLVLTDDFAVVLVLIPGGTFLMGAQKENPDAPGYDAEALDREGPVHKVTLQPFLLAKYEMTQHQSTKLLGRTQAQMDEAAGKPAASAIGDRQPLVNVKWDDIDQVLRGLPYRLPTESQWEYACRAGTTGPYSFAGGDEQASRFAWYGDIGGEAHPVGLKLANPFGLHDAHGNVWEWCLDWSDEYPVEDQKDPEGPSAGKDRVFRGGSFNDPADVLRSSYRNWRCPKKGDHLVGFRLAVSPPISE